MVGGRCQIVCSFVGLLLIFLFFIANSVLICAAPLYLSQHVESFGSQDLLFSASLLSLLCSLLFMFISFSLFSCVSVQLDIA